LSMCYIHTNTTECVRGSTPREVYTYIYIYIEYVLYAHEHEGMCTGQHTSRGLLRVHIAHTQSMIYTTCAYSTYSIHDIYNTA